MKVELIEQAMEVVNDKQLLVNIVSKRVQQLNQGADPFVPTSPEMGSGDIALTEIIEGKITWRPMNDDEVAGTTAAASDPFADMAQAAEEVAEVTILAD
ncbi:MAG: DNA-directed RNA polymerase subunit omega [Akkermansia sp.]